MQQPTTSAATSLWEEELQRAKQWLGAKEQQRQRATTEILQRVRRHMEFVALQKVLQREEEEDDDDDVAFEPDHEDGDDEQGLAVTDLALDFLRDVNPEDLKKLMEHEAATAALATSAVDSNVSTAAVAVAGSDAAPAQPAVVSTATSMTVPLQMPEHLLVRNTPPKRYASPAKSSLQPSLLKIPPLRLPAANQSHSVATPATGALLSDDPNVAELMTDLNLDISDVEHHLPPASLSDHEEHKTEESTSPHLRKAQQQAAAANAGGQRSRVMQELLDSVTTPTVKKYDAHDAKSKKHKKRRNVVSGRSDESASDEEQKSVETSRSTQRTALDPVAEEMRSWVTGYRDPEVLRRKESTPQRNRQHPKRFGVNSLEEQRYIDQVAKFYAEGSDAESDTDSPMSEGSDFSPADDVEEQDDGPLSDLELLSADDLNNDGSKKSRKKPRRRLRKEYRDSNCEKAAASQRKSPKKSKSPSNTISTQTELKQPTSSGSSKAAVSEQHRSSARKVNGFGGSSTVNQPIDLRSSGDEQSGSEHSSVEKSSRKITSTSSNSKDRRNEKPTVSALARDLAYVQSREPMPTSENKKTKGNTVIRRADPKKSTQHVTTSQPIVSSSPTKEKNNEALGANDVSRKSASKVSTRSQVVVSSRPGSMTSPTPETSNAEDKERVVAENGVNDVSKKSASKANGQADEVSATEIKAAKRKDEEPAHVESSEQTAVPGLSKALLARHQEMIRNITSCQMSDEEFSETETVDLEAEDSEEIDVNLDARGVEDEEMHGNSKSATQEAERETAVPSGGDSDSAKLPSPNHKVQTQQASDPTNKPVGSQEEGKVSDAETMICDDSKAQNGIEEFEFGSSSRLDDLGFSDNSDDDTSNESTGAVAPHDDEYEQFFADASEKKKRKAKQKQEFKVAEQKPSESAKASDRTPDVEFIKFVPTPTSKENEKTKSATAAAKKESLGSNGLRKTTVISRSTMMKGKFAHSRRSIQLLDEDESLKSNGMRYDLAKNVQQNGTRKSNGTTKKRYSEPLVSVEQEVRTTTEFAFKAVSSSSGSARKSYGPNVFSKQDNNVTKKDDAAVDKRDERYSSNGSKSSDTRERADDKLEARYLSYTAKSKSKETTSRKYDSDDEPLSASVVKTSSKSRFGGSDIETPKVSFTSDVEKTPSWSFSPMVKSSNENIDANAANKMVYPRERQLDIYDALHIEGREENGLSARDLRDGEYKRPSAHSKLVEEKKKQGISFVTKEKFLETAPIPKKKIVPSYSLPTKTQPKEHADESDKRPSTKKSKSSQSSSKGGKTPVSHYGPSSESTSSSKKLHSERNKDRYNLSKHSASSWTKKDKQGRKDDSREYKKSSSPLGRRSSESDYRSKTSSSRSSEKDRDRRREHSRSRSLQRRDRDRYSKTRSSSPSRKRYRSHSRSRSHERDERSRYHNDKRDRDAKSSSSSKKERSPSSVDARSEKKQRTGSLDRGSSSRQREHNGHDDRSDKSSRKREYDGHDNRSDSGKKSKVSADNKSTTSRHSSDAIADGPVFDYESDMFISDSDDDQENGSQFNKEPDIRFDLESMKVDARHLNRKVYVSGINATVDEELLTELFSPFGIEIDKESGFPLIDVFLCQRSLRPRGDACITFESADGAMNAVEEINAKIVKNGQIEVRLMDLHTQRVLGAQFNQAQEIWKCVGQECRSEVSIWNNKCDKCFRKRMFGPSRVCIKDRDWLCSICFTANAEFSTECHSCNSSLPQTNRAQFYKN